jgi:two-component system NarL family sensor kinase
VLGKWFNFQNKEILRQPTAQLFIMPLPINTREKLVRFFVTGTILLTGFFLHAQKMNEDSLKRVIREAKEDTTRIDAMLSYGNYLFRGKNEDSAAFAMFLSAKYQAEQANYVGGRTQALLFIGNYYGDQSDWSGAINAYDSILKIADKIPDEKARKRAIRGAYNNLGGIYNKNGDFTSSLEYRLKCLQVIESMPSPNPNEIAIASINAASDYRQLKEFGKAEQYINKITPIFSKLQDRIKLEYFFEYYSIALAGKENEKAQQVLYRFDSILQVSNFSEMQKKDYSLLSQKLHGVYEMEYRNDYKKALIHFNTVLPLAKELGVNREIGEANYNLGWASYWDGKYQNAIDYLNTAYTIAIENDLKNQAFKAADLLSFAYKKMNSMVKALEFSHSALALKDSVVTEDANRQLNFLDARYQSEKKERAIATLQTENQAKEFVIRKKNWFIIGGIVLVIFLGMITFTVINYYHNRQLLLKKEKVLQEEKIAVMEKQQQVASLQSMINGQETERTRIARDLHDGMGGILSTVKMHYSTLTQDTPVIRENPLYKKTLDLINEVSDQLRTVAHSMMPEVLMKVGLTEALRDFCNNVSSSKRLTVKLQSYGMEKRLSSSTEINLFRIIQELVNNIIKHANATEAIIQINRQGNNLHLIIEDNGRGFDTTEAEAKRSMGMSTVKSRVSYLNGKLTIDSKEGIGTTVMIDLVLDEN